MTKADDARELAGYVAPIVRGTSETLLRRRVKTYDRETGEVTGEVTMRQVIGGLAEVTALEIDVIDGKRPKHFTCDGCGKVFEMPKKGPILKVCDMCRTGGQAVCPCGCGKVPPRAAFRPSVKAKRGGGVWRCRPSTCSSCGKDFVSTSARQRVCPASIGGCLRQTACGGGCGTTPTQKQMATCIEKRGRSASWVCSECLKGVPRKTRQSPDERRASYARRGASAARRYAELTDEERDTRMRRMLDARLSLPPKDLSAVAVKAWETKRGRAVVLPSPDGGAQKTGAND